MKEPLKQRCRSSHGFTLIEVMVSMTIMAMILGIAYSGLRLSLNAWERGGKAIVDLDRRVVVERLLRRQLAMAYPMEITGGRRRETNFVSRLKRTS
jgi:general secretion pathway protein J